ncbi:unnamed protein product [Dibothriocephalus latus]|uniref:Uncharacterized protein n=1 Tax=Dibothriocephalus latus TaxID=60516 RepID=A0A3P7P224_DIBLA|nr:unnamed protein product [Dibothriocephalus latus]
MTCDKTVAHVKRLIFLVSFPPSALAPVQTSDPTVKGKRLEVWELRPKWEPYNPLLVQPFIEKSLLAREATSQLGGNTSDSNIIPDAYYEDFGAQQPEVEANAETARPPYGDAAQEFDKRSNLLAVTEVPRVAGRVGTTLYITGRFREWVAYRNRHPMLPRLIRTILIVCLECDPDVDPIDTRKVSGSGRGRNILGDFVLNYALGVCTSPLNTSVCKENILRCMSI